jgi:ABC-type transport system involved in cytochrome bd biosynthesis fused ATPase/permease subunit
MQICRVCIFFTLNCATPFSLILTFIAYGLSHPTLDTRVAFTIVGFLNLLVGPFQNTGIAVIMLSAFLPSLGRIGLFFQSPTLTSYVEMEAAGDTKPYVEIKDGVFKWPKADVDTLRDVNFRVNDGEKLLVIGKVGCGKTSVMECLMGNIPKKQGVVKIAGTVAYLPQTPWIYNATVRYTFFRTFRF